MPSANALHLTKKMADAYFGSGSFKFLLVSSAPSESDLDSIQFRSGITNEVTGTGYTAGGVAVTVTVGSVDTANNRVPVTIGNLSPGWTGATLSAVGGWLYKVIGSAGTDEVCTYVDFGATVSPSAQNLQVTFSSPLYVNR